MAKSNHSSDTPTHPALKELLDLQDTRYLMIDGYGTACGENRVRIYADLDLGTYIELAESDVLRRIDSSAGPDGPTSFALRADAEVVMVETARMRVADVIAAAISVPPMTQCGCGSGEELAAARVPDRGPVVDICSWSCTERLSDCRRWLGGWRRAWCYFSYVMCRLKCVGPPTIPT